ncbi:MAG TPA: metal-dependent hydrolase [Gemmatimonadales bacterium]|nr:metal-dependent hydrolase [Gemmatimonadales bacterium]
MFIGHYALGFAAKRLAPRTSLGTLFAAPTLADLLWPVFLLLGWEQARVVPGPNPFLNLWLDNIPISHSLLTLIGWGVLFGYLYRTRTGYARGALVVGLLVVSHWVLDVVTHRPDMPLYPSSVKVGLGLWNSVAGTLIVEGLLFITGMVIYMRTTRPRDGIGRWGFWAFIVVLVGSYVSTLFAPPPTNMTAVAVFGIVFGWLFVLVGWWVDKHREAL